MAEEITIATVNNGDMCGCKTVPSVGRSDWQRDRWVVLEENVLRQNVTHLDRRWWR
jgi:hypothetical protein